MFNLLISLIITFIRWIDSTVRFYVHLKSTFEAAFHIAQHNYPTSGSERRQARTTTYKQPLNSCSIKANRVLFSKKRPFQKLPNEIIIKILRHLDRKDLFQCVSVSSIWNQLTVPLLWTSARPKRPILGCTGFAYGEKTNRHLHCVSSEFPLQLSHYGQSIKSLDLSLVASAVNNCTVRYILRHCPRLKKISLTDCNGITDESLRLLARSPIAENLRTIILQNCKQITDKGLYYLAERCHKVEVLHLGGCELITKKGLKSLLSKTGETVRNIRINDCPLLDGIALHYVSVYCGSSIEIADFSCLSFKHSDIVQLAMFCSNITRLDISLKKPERMERSGRALFARMDEEHHIHEFGGLFDSLYYHQIRPNLSVESSLHLEHIMEQRRVRDLVSDRTVIHIGTYMKKLVRLDVINWICLTDNSIRFLTSNCTELTTIGLSGCSSITKTTHKHCRSLRSSSSSV